MFRELTRKNQRLTPEECREVLFSALRGVLCVHGDDGYPYAVPMNFLYCPDESRIYFHGGRAGHKIDALRRNPKVSFNVLDSGTPSAEGWWLIFRSVTVFGEIEFIEDAARVIEISRRLSARFTQDAEYIEHEIALAGSRTLCLALHPQHICGKRVSER